MTLPSHVDHLVVGAGFSGVALAIGLQQDGEEFLVIEKDEALGGTWWANTYPGATCDIPSHLYSFSFAPNPDWSHAYSPQADGRTLAETWAGSGMTTYKGATTHGFPNLFSVLGANTGQGHTSVIVYIEALTDYVRGAIRTMRRGGYAVLEPRADAQDRWNADIQRRMRRTVWARGGCTSWYLDDHGRNPITWPRGTIAFRRAVKDFDVDAYDVRSAS